MSTPYAEGSQVSVEKSKNELDALLRKHGANQRGNQDDDLQGVSLVFFRLKDRQVRLMVPLPKFAAFATFERKGKPVERTPEDQAKQFEQACRTRWRAVVLVVKAKLELIEIGMSDVEREFLADITLPDGRSVGELLKPMIQQAYLNGAMPPAFQLTAGPAKGVVEGTLE